MESSNSENHPFALRPAPCSPSGLCNTLRFFCRMVGSLEAYARLLEPKVGTLECAQATPFSSIDLCMLKKWKLGELVFAMI